MATKSETDPNMRRIGGEEGASLTTVSVPLVLDISPTQLASLPEQRRGIVNLISTTAQETLTKWDKFTFQLPQTEFVRDQSSGQTLEPLVGVADLCIQPDETDELAEITRDPETGERRRITAEQYREIVEYGRFSFPSRQFPHINHVWQLPSWMVRGRKNIAKNFNKRLGYSLDHLVVFCPNRIYHKPDPWEVGFHSSSIGNGIYRIARQLKSIVATVIGLPETVPRRKEYKLRMEAEKQFVRQKCTNSELLDFSYYFDSSPSPEHYPLRLAGEKASAYDETYRIAALRTFQHVSPDDLSTSERVSRIEDNWRQDMREEQLQQALQNEPDEQKSVVLAEYLRAQHINQDGQAKLNARMEREKHRFLEEAKRTHPILSLSHAWLARWVTKKAVKHLEEWQRAQEDENIAVMRSKDLHRAAKFEEGKLEFEREVWPDLRASWFRDQVPAKVYEHTYVIFNPRDEGEEGGVRRVRTTTGHVGWRLVLIWRDTVSFLRSGVYFTVITNLWRGPLGIQALFRFDDVPYSWVVSHGDARPQEFRLSMTTRLRAIWRRVRELRREFEEGEDTVFGKATVRWLHFITNYGFRGGVSTVLVIIGQPLLTVLNVIASAFITGTAVVWAPFSALLTYCWSWLMFDWRGFQRYNVQRWELENWSNSYTHVSIERSPICLPVISCLLGGVAGVLEACISALGLLIHPTYSVFRCTLACVQRGVRVLWDSMWNFHLRRFGRWPSKDSFLAQRVSGVGISGTYYFRLSTDLVTRCLRARLELIELDEARRIIREAAAKPVSELEAFSTDLLTGLYTHGSWGETMSQLRKEEEWRMILIENEFGKREKMLHRLTDIHNKARIRPENGVSAEDLLESCVEIVNRFYGERIVKLGRVSTELWSSAGAAPGDVKTLTRYLLADLFSEEFLTPLEIAEETLEIPVTFDDVINVHARGNGDRYGREDV